MAFVGAVIAGTTATLTAGTTLLAVFASSILGNFLISTVLGAALRALSPKPSTAGSNRGYQTNQQGPAQDHSVIYGEVKVGGAIIYDEATGTNNKFLHRVIAVAGHEIDSFVNFYINDELATVDGGGNVTYPNQYRKDAEGFLGTALNPAGNPLIRINTHLGSPTQVADEDLVSESSEWDNSCTLNGIAYIYIRMEFNADAFPNGVPTFTTTVRGKKVYDPRTNTVAYSANPALCMRDYLTSGKGADDTTSYSYGLGEDVVNVDDALVIASADVCDQTNTDAGTVRYDTNGSFTTAATPYDTITAMLTAMGGSMWYAQGAWRMKAAYWTAPVMDLNEDDLRSGISVGTRHSRRDNFNTIKGTFRGLESDWQVTDYPEVTNAGFVSADGGQVSVADVDLPFTDTSITSRRLGLISLERNRQQLTVNASYGLRTLGLQVGDNVRLTNSRFGWVNKEFEVIQWSFGLVDDLDLQVDMSLRETAESVFDEVNDGIVYERDNTQLLSPFSVPSVGLSATVQAKVFAEKLVNQLSIFVTSAAEERVDHVEVQFRSSDETEFTGVGTGVIGKFVVIDLQKGFYDVRARAVNTFGIRGEFEFLVNIEVDALSLPPANVANFSHELSGGSLFLSWASVPDLDLSYYEVKHNPSTVGATWGQSNTVLAKVARPATNASLPARSGTFLIKAYDKNLNESVTSSTLVVLPAELPPLGTEQSITEDPTFGGTKTNAIVVDDQLEISDTSASNPTATYLMQDDANFIDTGSSRTCRVTGSTTFERLFDDGTLLWDDVPQNFDTWPDNFDGFTDESAAFGDVSAAVFVRATNDDPSASPVYGPFTLANGADVVGRAFEFKAVLNSTNTKYTPSVVTLSAKVEY